MSGQETRSRDPAPLLDADGTMKGIQRPRRYSVLGTRQDRAPEKLFIQESISTGERDAMFLEYTIEYANVCALCAFVLIQTLTGAKFSQRREGSRRSACRYAAVLGTAATAAGGF